MSIDSHRMVCPSCGHQVVVNTDHSQRSAEIWRQWAERRSVDDPDEPDPTIQLIDIDLSGDDHG
ncbi:MAG: hypothetical protein JNL84_00620 [Candidatus Accumulibacter sp.]|nr:hypothetical protein [Accumulibacter sp.]